MTDTFLVKYLNDAGVEQYKLIEAEDFSADGEPHVEVEGSQTCSIPPIQHDHGHNHPSKQRSTPS